MNDTDKEVIRTRIAPALAKGEISLLLGAGFSRFNLGSHGQLPTGDGLKDLLLNACGKKSGPKTTLKDAYLMARRELPDVENFLKDCFTVTSAFSWQEKIFQYPWARIYTTNIDNVLDVAVASVQKAGRVAGDFKFFNYTDIGHVSATIGSIPVVTIHGTCKKLEDGFVFSSLEYARAASRLLDWHNDLAARMIAGGLVVIGNQLDESDIDTYIAKREETFGPSLGPENWIISPSPDEIKAANWRSSGFYVFDATAEEFLTEVYACLKPLTVGDVMLERVPTAKKALADIRSMTWFKGAFHLAFEEIEGAQKQTGLLKRFITGADPDWFYIVNKAHAKTEKGTELLSEIANLMQMNATGLGVLHVVGPSGSGKTTAIRNALSELVHTYRYVYEFDDHQSIDRDYLRAIINRFSEKSIFVFYSATEYYYAVKEIINSDKDSRRPYCLFILEARASEFNKNKRQIVTPGVAHKSISFGELVEVDAKNIAAKIEETGLSFEHFSEFPMERRARIILDKERGYGGDLLSALFSLTTNENFEQKIFQDYQGAETGIQRNILDVVTILHSQGFTVPVDYIAGALGERADEVTRCIKEDLAGVVVIPDGMSVAKCRHRVIANYYFENHIAGQGQVEMLSGILEFLSRQFTVEDIKFHPLSYRIYRELVSFEFVYEKYFPRASRDTDCERLYHEVQRFFGRDGIFWLHFGRYYRKMERFSEAIDCFRTGLEFYNSFQTRHSLGMTLVEQFIFDDQDERKYQEGIGILDAEREGRGSSDSYPTATMLVLFSKMLRRVPQHVPQDARDRAKKCINFGLKYFRDDDYFMGVANEYLAVERRNAA